MKKALSCLLALLLILSGLTAFAEQVDTVTFDEGAEMESVETADAVEDDYVPAEYELTELTVGHTTQLNGYFFTEMWGDNTSDLDVRLLLHGYNLIQWHNEEGGYQLNDIVASGVVVLDDPEGNRTYTLAINDDLTYCDGTPITAKDYIFSILMSMAPEVAELDGMNDGTSYILGADEYRADETEVLKGVRLLGDYQFSVTVKAEYLPFFYEMALLNFCPYPISVIAPGCQIVDNGEGVAIVNIDPEIEEPIFTADLLRETIFNEETGYMSHPSVTSGPYMLTSFDGTTASFEANPYFKGDMNGWKPEIQHIDFTLAHNEDMIEKLESGEFGLLNKVTKDESIQNGTALTATGYYGMSNYPRTGLSFMAFCCEKPTVESKSVRQAIAYCVDKDALVADAVGNYGLRVDGYYGIGQWMYLLVNGTTAAPVEELAEDATDEEKAAHEAELAEWDALSLDEVPVYNLDLEAALKLLVDDGWTLNEQGEEFNPETDTIRCKMVNDELVALDLTMIYPEGNTICDVMPASLIDNLAQVGIALTLEAKPMPELLQIYYRHEQRDCDMVYLASNFSEVFDPSLTFSVEDADQGAFNRTAIKDEELERKTIEMRQTEPGAVLEYCQKWIEFQKQFADTLPLIPVYSNVYFDFYTSHLQGYPVASNISWAEAIVESYMEEFQTEEETEETGEEAGEEGLVTFD